MCMCNINVCINVNNINNEIILLIIMKIMK